MLLLSLQLHLSLLVRLHRHLLPPMLQPQPSPRQQVSRQQLPLPASLPPPPPLSNPPHARERVDLPPPPPLPEKHDPPIVTLDDLFRKTKTTPRIYYLPLSEEQVAAKLAGHGKNTKQSAGVASRKELFRPSRGMWFVAGFGFFRRLHGVEAKERDAEYGMGTSYITLTMREEHDGIGLAMVSLSIV
ncbi:hypothetical protein OIU78_020882 [Salix suchowensis]|nr:hypothetical protein OIU78_020882 [Salix suchowensis]